jgi:type I restriction enzyme, S subunit
MIDIPSDWERISLHKIAHIQTGIAKGSKDVKDPVYLPYLRVANVQDGYLDLSEIKEIEIDRRDIERYLLQDQDILLTEGGDFDKLGRGTIWRNQISPCVHQNHVFAVRLDQSVILPYFFAQQTASPYGKQYFLSIAKQTTNLASINKGQLSEFPVLLPPLPEQRKIAEILTTWDEAIALTERLIDALKQRKQALMQLLLTGQVRFPEFEGKEWETVRLDERVDDFLVPMRDKPQEFRGEIPWCRIEDINDMYLSKSLSGQAVDDDIVQEMNLRVFPKGTVIVSCSANLGVSAIVATPLVTNQTFIGLVVGENLDNRFLYHLMSHSAQRLQRLSSGTTIAYLSRQEFEKFIVDIPPSKTEQIKIADVLSQVDLQIKDFGLYQEQLRQQKRGLMQRLLTGQVRVAVEDE